MFSMFVDTIEGRAEFRALLAGTAYIAPDPLPASLRERQIVRVRGGQVVSRRIAPAAPVARRHDTMSLNLAALAKAFAARLREAGGDAFTDEQAAEYATALQTDMPRSRRALYCMSRDVFLSGRQHLDLFNEVFAEVFGAQGDARRYRDYAPAPATAVAGMR
jgi:uncharacterized protein with von Willebrand factor type A (vWA) domain